MNLSGALCRENFTNDNDWQNYYKDKTNFNEDTIWLNPASGDYIYPKQMELNIQGLVKKEFNSCVHYFSIKNCVHICHARDKNIETIIFGFMWLKKYTSVLSTV